MVDVELIDGRYLLVNRFAERTGRSLSYVLRLLRERKLDGKKEGRKWFVDMVAYSERLQKAS